MTQSAEREALVLLKAHFAQTRHIILDSHEGSRADLGDELEAELDEAEKFISIIDAAISGDDCSRQTGFGMVQIPVAVQQNIWEFCYDVASYAQSLVGPPRRVFFQRAKDIAVLFEGISASASDLPRGLQSAFKWKCETIDGEMPNRPVTVATAALLSATPGDVNEAVQTVRSVRNSLSPERWGGAWQMLDQVERVLLATTPPAPTDEAADRELLAEEIDDSWQDLLDKDDRTSPDEYPDHALITFKEFDFYIRSAVDLSRKASVAVDRDAVDKIASRLLVDACELPDRTSPEDYPEMLLMTPEELRGFLRCAMLEALGQDEYETMSHKSAAPNDLC